MPQLSVAALGLILCWIGLPGAFASESGKASQATSPAAGSANSGAGAGAGSTLPGTRKDASAIVRSALRAAAGDIDGDGRADLALIDGAVLRVVTPEGREIARSPVTGGIQSLSVADVERDGSMEILAGWGETSEHREATARISLFRLIKGKLAEETILSPMTSRHEVVAVLPQSPGSLLIACFHNRYGVESYIATHPRGSGWTGKFFGALRMAASWAVGDVNGDSTSDTVVGRIYGDTESADGDAFILREDHTRVRIPTTRGVKSLVIADSDADGRSEVFLGDGWHRNIAMAHGLVTWSRWDGRAFRSEIIEDTGERTITRLIATDVDGDGRPEIVALGPSLLRVFKRTANGWRGLTVGGRVRDVAFGNFDDIPGNELLLVSDHSEVVNLHDARWP